MTTPITYREFNTLLKTWYNKYHPKSSKPKSHLIGIWYDDYLKGRHFKFIRDWIKTSYGVSVKVYNETEGSICVGEYGLSNPYIVYPDGKIAFDLGMNESRYLRACKAIKLVLKTIK